MTIRAVRAVRAPTMKQFLNGQSCIAAREAAKHKKTYIVSISNPGTPSLLQEDTDERISLQFHDAYPNESEGLTLFDQDMAVKICRLVKKAQDDSADVYFLINCHAGVSRSGAVSEFIGQMFVDYEAWERANSMVNSNFFVLKLLETTWEQLYG